MTEFIDKHPVKMQVVTLIVAVLFIVGATKYFSDDRNAAYSTIKENQRMIESLDTRLCSLEDMVNASLRDLISADHRAEISYTEIKARLITVEAMLIKIDRRLSGHGDLFVKGDSG